MDASSFSASFPAAGDCLILFPLPLWPRNMTLSGFKDSVIELIHFVGRLASVGLQLEGCNALLLSFVLDFYETVTVSLTHGEIFQRFSSCTCAWTRLSCLFLAWFLLPQVCDTFVKYKLPLMVMPPAGVFYPALLATEPLSVDRLAYIMYRWASFSFLKIILILVVNLLHTNDWISLLFQQFIAGHCKKFDLWLGCFQWFVISLILLSSVFCSGTRWTWHQPRAKKQSKRWKKKQTQYASFYWKWFWSHCVSQVQGFIKTSYITES